jgi:hypothetical protein
MNTTWLVATSLIAFLAIGQQPGWEAIRIDPERDLNARIGRITGEVPEDCGRLMSPGTWGQPAYGVEELQKPIACAGRAARARRAFAVVLKTLGFDSWTATGLLGGTDGVVRLFTYDNLYGKGTLRTSRCETPDGRVNADGFVYISCDAPQANHGLQPTR